MPEELDDTASNPFNDAHLPVAGESDTGTGLMGADIADDMHVSEPDDVSDLSNNYTGASHQDDSTEPTTTG